MMIVDGTTEFMTKSVNSCSHHGFWSLTMRQLLLSITDGYEKFQLCVALSEESFQEQLLFGFQH